MAKTPTPKADHQAESFVREVDEAYRQDRLASFWTSYGRWLLILVGLALIGFAVYLYLQERETETSAIQAEEFDQAVRRLELGDPDARDTLERVAGGDAKGYSDIAKLLRAGFLYDDGDEEGAVAAYRAVADDLDVPEPLRDLATIRAARITFDEADPRGLINELEPIAQPDSAWHGVAGEMVAAAYLKVGDEAKAAAIYRGIADDETLPPTLRERAAQLAEGYSSALSIEEEAAPDEPLAPAETNE